MWVSKPQTFTPASPVVDHASPLAGCAEAQSLGPVSFATLNGSATSAGWTSVGTIGQLPPLSSTPVAAENALSSVPARGGDPLLNTKGTLKGECDAIQLYMRSSHVGPEEKTVVSTIMAALANYTQTRLRITQHLDEGEMCLRKLAQLHNSIDVAAKSFTSSPSSGLTDSLLSLQPHQQQQNLVGATFSTANLQRGRAKVDTDLAECRGMLQQVEAFARTLQDIHKTQARVCASLKWEEKEEQQESQKLLHPSKGVATTTAVPVALLHTTLDDCISQLCQFWDASVTTAVRSLYTRLREHFHDTGDMHRSHEEIADNGRTLPALLQLCDSTLDRIETMRSRITRLGSSRIEEAESLERLLASLDNYDPTAEEHARRRKQIDTELEGLRGWLGHIGQLRQRAVVVIETLQQGLINSGGSVAGSGRTSPCHSFGGNVGSAQSSHRPSGAGPSSAGEWRQTLLLPDEAGVRGAHASHLPSPPPSTLLSNCAADVDSGRAEGDAVDGTDVGVPTAAPLQSPQSQLLMPPITNNTDKSSRTTAAEVVDEKEGSALAPESSGGNNNGKEGGILSDYKSGNYEGDDSESSDYHPSAFDAGERRRWRQRKRDGGYLGSIKAFTTAILKRATRFSDSEDESTTGSDQNDDDDDDAVVSRQRQRRRVE